MAKLGNKNKVYITSSLVTALSEVTAADVLVGETSNTLTINANLIEVSDKTTEWGKNVPGIKGGTLSVTVNVEDGNTKQEALIDAITAGSEINCFEGDLNSNGFAFKALVGSIAQTNDNGSVATWQLEITANGEVKRIKI